MVTEKKIIILAFRFFLKDGILKVAFSTVAFYIFCTKLSNTNIDNTYIFIQWGIYNTYLNMKTEKTKTERPIYAIELWQIVI